MPIRLIFIVAVALSIGAVVKVVGQQINFIGNNAEILTASNEVHILVRMIYIDYVISGRGINNLHQDSFADYLRRNIKVRDSTTDPARDPWMMPYHFTLMRNGSYEVRSAGPDLEFNTNDDIVAFGE